MFKLNYDSYYKKYANQSLDWLTSDTKELYEKNLVEQIELLNQFNWVDKSFTYKFNSHGFRCDEFTTDPTIMFLGCSHTCGIGLPVETIWPELVAKHLNMRCANLGIGGSSNDTAFRLCHHWIDVIQPKIVIFLQPLKNRLELVNHTESNNLSILWSDKSSDRFHNFLKDWSIDDNNSHLNSLKNKLAIESICASKKIKLIVQDTDEFVRCRIDLARDLMHYGVDTHKKFTDRLLTKI